VQAGEPEISTQALAEVDRAGMQVRTRRDWGLALIGWLAARRLVLAVGLAAALPIIVSAAHAVVVGWAPLDDDAQIATRAFDVFSMHSPLVGEWSAGASGVLGRLVYEPGPLLYWLLAVPARFLDPSSLPVTVGLVNVASVVAVVGLARRRGGRPLMFAVAIAVPVMLASLPPDTYSDVWTPSALLLPFTLLSFLAWSLACGEYRLWPVTVLVASYVAQTELSFMAPTVGLTAGALVLAAVSRRFLSVRGPQGANRRSRWKWTLGGLAVGLVCWSAPLLDQVVHRPGNLLLLARAATTSKPTEGWHVGWRAVVEAVGLPPAWLRPPLNFFERFGDLTTTPKSTATASAFLVLVGLAGVAVAGWRRRRRDVFAAGALGLIVCAAVAADAASTPTNAFGTVYYTLRWTSPAGMFVWVVLGWALATLPRLSVRLTEGQRRTLPALGLAATVAAGSVVAGSAGWLRQPYHEMRVIAHGLDVQLPSGGARVESSSPGSLLGLKFEAGIVYALRREGRNVTLPEAAGWGSQYGRGAYRQTVRVDLDTLPSGRGRRIARFTIREPGTVFDPGQKTTIVTVTILHAN
jgi:hypothetical protein